MFVSKCYLDSQFNGAAVKSIFFSFYWNPEVFEQEKTGEFRCCDSLGKYSQRLFMSRYDVEREEDNQDREAGVKPITMDAVI